MAANKETVTGENLDLQTNFMLMLEDSFERRGKVRPKTEQEQKLAGW